MKKISLFLLGILLITGCSFSDMMNTPIKRVEEFLGKYQTMDSEVLNQLDDVISRNDSLDDNQKKEYKELMKRQYQNLMYKIKEETVDGNSAKVDVEIEVYDYHSAIVKADQYLEEHKDEFVNEEGTLDQKKFMDYKIEKMKETKEKVKYTLNFTLTKKENKWTMDEITETIRQKIHGIYES